MTRDEAIKLISKIPVSEIATFRPGDRRIEFMTNGTASCIFKALTVLMAKSNEEESKT